MTIEEKNRLIKQYTYKINQLTLVINKMESQGIKESKIIKAESKKALYEDMLIKTQNM